MSVDLSLQTTTYQVADRRWLLAEPDVKLNVTLDISKFSQTGTSAVQTVSITGAPTGGTWTATFNGQTTSAIAYNATAAAVQSALTALSSVGANNVTVTGTGPYTVTFTGALASKAVPVMTASGAGLTGGTSPAASVANTTPGSNAHYPNGYIPSGTAIGIVTATGLAAPYNAGASDGSQTCYGITYGDCRAVRQNGTIAAKVGTGAVVNMAVVSLIRLPFQAGTGSIDAAAKTSLAQIRFEA
ncbi:head decoration protein [Nocardia panacis]|uniref:Head decoration protein n=1 Tax=Nocardia panacis TaxID=2340916 RepID=A0A3A4KIE1_9NOCA|nr:head decoration protein [Nocardia panacis]RJO74165.1 head decoration protein [Nocardia panacis]